MNHLRFFSIVTTLILVTSFAFAKSSIISEVDQNLTVHAVGILPCTDNTNGVYCRYVETKLKDEISDAHRFSLVELKDTDPRLSPEDYSKQSEIIRTLGQKNRADAMIVAQIEKKEKAINIRLDLYLGADGLLFATEQIDNETKYDVSDVERKVVDLYKKLIAKIPYKGLVLSRQGQRVTTDLGSYDGIKDGTVLTIEQIVELKRHPKFHFILSSEKEVIGRIKIIKTEPKMSFAIVLQEKEKNAIAKNSKLSGTDFINYPDTSPQTPAQGPVNPPNDGVSFGKNPREWKPDKEPVLGYVGVSMGIGPTHYATTLTTAGNIVGDNAFYPQIDLRGEIWLTRNWAFGGGLRQGIYTMGNTLSGSTPGTLKANNGHYYAQGSYKFLLQDEFWGPQIAASLGFLRYDLFVDAATPIALTSTVYSGMYLGIAGHVPIDEEKIYVFDVELRKVLFPTMTETPVSSAGASDNSITTISIGGSYKLNTNFRLKAGFDFEFYSSTFSGMGTRADIGLNSSQSLTTLLVGLDYYF